MRTICRGALFLGLLVGSTHADVAAAYWQSGGTNTGEARLVKPLRVNQTAELASVSPGFPAQTLSGTFENLNGQPVHVSTVRVSIGAVIKAPGAAAGSCDASDFTLRHRTITVGADVPSGRGTDAWTGGAVAFNNKPGIDQNACQGATVKLAYTTA
ncbi:MAG: hypothetical protein ABI611_09500 [Solirubrobacteraceae bacterium]